MIKIILKILVFIVTASIGGFVLVLIAAHYLPDKVVDKNIPWNNSLTYKIKPAKSLKHKFFAECVDCIAMDKQNAQILLSPGSTKKITMTILTTGLPVPATEWLITANASVYMFALGMVMEFSAEDALLYLG